MKKIAFFLFIIYSSFSSLTANINVGDKYSDNLYFNDILNSYEDSLAQLKHFYDNEWTYSKGDLLRNPYYCRLLLQGTYYADPVTQQMKDLWTLKTKAKLGGFTYNDFDVFPVLKNINNILAQIYTLHPSLITIAENQIEQVKSLREDLVVKKVETSDRLSTKKNIELPVVEISKVNPIVHRPNFWRFVGNYSLQFMQRYISDNWYRSGESSNSLLANVTFSANYNNKQKVSLENKLEMRLGFVTSEDDSINAFKTNNDLIRMTNKLGFRATKYWYYTFFLQSWTQFYPGYRSNNKKVYSDFMSPFDALFSIGLDYKRKEKVLNLSAYISPLALKAVYVDRNNLRTSFGLNSRRHVKYDFGSNVTVSSNWKISNDIKWNTRLYFFTNYEKVQIEWENTIDFILNRYLSAKLFLYPRFDDSINRGNDESYIQFSEYLSLGFNYDF